MFVRLRFLCCVRLISHWLCRKHIEDDRQWTTARQAFHDQIHVLSIQSERQLQLETQVVDLKEDIRRVKEAALQEAHNAQMYHEQSQDIMRGMISDLEDRLKELKNDLVVRLMEIETDAYHMPVFRC